MEEKTGEQQINSFDKAKAKQKEWLAPFQFKPGQSGNPSGRPKGKSLKEYAKEMLLTMTDEERQQFLKGINKQEIWKMAEGLPQQDITSGGKILPAPILNINEICKDERDNKDNALEQENKVCPGGDSGKQDNINNNLSDSPSAD